MPKETSIQKVLVIGSGPIVIGQAAEFDYSGTQACLALKEEGLEVILVNNNPATVMTDETCADKVYFEPLTVASLEKIIAKERPDGLLATLGGQTGLNLAFALHQRGILQTYQVELLGTPTASIQQGEDREKFRALMHELGEPVPDSEIVDNVEDAVAFADATGYPIIIRPAYTLGGGGGGIAHTEEQLRHIVAGGLDLSPIRQCLIEKSIAGFKEIEFEVMRDENDTCITICSMENIDPVGIHTGDSIVVAPAQTLTLDEFQMLRMAAMKVVRALKIVGGCNVQFALDPESKQYYFIEVNPRVSRSSALASKATGYPIARIAAKLSLGYLLHELINPVTGYTYASFEPALDYVVVKFPRWPFDKFVEADRSLGTQMKATGEVMAIERNLMAALQKAVRSLELNVDGLSLPSLRNHSVDSLFARLDRQDDERFFILLELLRRDISIETLHEKTKINRYFLQTFFQLVQLEKEIEKASWSDVTKEQLFLWKKAGFSDEWLASVWDVSPTEVLEKRKQWNLFPTYHMVDTSAAEYRAKTPYFYSSWQQTTELKEETGKPKILIIGSGPIRIGQGIEFDYCSVQGAIEVQKHGYEAVMMNNNPETVSTDFNTADHLYFEPLTAEDVLHVAWREQVEAVIVQLGGQTGISLTKQLEDAGLRVLGTSADTIDQLEDRGRFYDFMREVNVPHIPGVTGINEEDVKEKARSIGFPVLLRPSYVIGGQGMAILTNEEELNAYLSKDTVTYPILIDAFLPGIEIEVDVVTDGKDIYIPGIFEHIERAGVHSGDSFAVTPPFSLSKEIKDKVVAYTARIAQGMDFIGVFNIQFVWMDEELYVIEVNPRASRTVPILSKVTGTNLIEGAVQMWLGKSLKEWNNGRVGLGEETPYYTVKAPVFSNRKLSGIDPILEAEMKSTGELIGIGRSREEALKKAFAWSESETPLLFQQTGTVFCDIDESVKEETASALEKLRSLGYTIVTDSVCPFSEWVKTDEAVLYISLPKVGHKTGKKRRQEALKERKTIVTNPQTLSVLVAALTEKNVQPESLQGWLTKAKSIHEGV